MNDYTVGSLGSLISGNLNKQSGPRISYEEVQPRKRPKKTIGIPEVSSKKSKVFNKLQKKGERIKESLLKVLETKKRRPEIAGSEPSGTIGRSWKQLSRSGANESEVDGLLDVPEKKNSSFARNAARRVHIKNNTKKHVDDPDREARTIFVGNIPYSQAQKKKLIKMFSHYGDVESLRLRCVPLSDPRTSKKVAVIKKEFHPQRSSISAYVVYKTEEQACSALEANGTLFQDHHLRVDLAKNANAEVDPRQSVFIGNLKFETEEEDLWKLFSSCGEINSVRIVRDSLTAVSKGIAFVNFKSPDAVELALQLNGQPLAKRPLSVKRYKPNSSNSPSQANNFKASQLMKKTESVRKVSQPVNITKKKKKDKRKKQRVTKESPNLSKVVDDPKETSGKEAGNESTVHNGMPTKKHHLNVKHSQTKFTKRSAKAELSFMGQTIEKSKRKKKKVAKGEAKKKKLALILTGPKQK